MLPLNVGVLLVLLVLPMPFAQGGSGDSLMQDLEAKPFAELKKVIGNPLSLITENTYTDHIVKNPLKGFTDLLSAVDLSKISMNPSTFVTKYMPAGFGDSLTQGLGETSFTDFKKNIGNTLSLIMDNINMDSVKNPLKGVTGRLPAVDLTEIAMNLSSFITKYIPGLESTPFTDLKNAIGNPLSLITEATKMDSIKNRLKDVADLLSGVDLSEITMTPNSFINKSLPNIDEIVYIVKNNLKVVTDLASGVDLSKISMNSSAFITEYLPIIVKIFSVFTDVLQSFSDV